MRKKWTYVAVACMLLGTAPVFTGCIDTDEPAGLEDLRQAKSELLRARVAVEEANAYKISAEAALLEAQQAIVAAEARYKEALAQQEEYIALKKQYEAELQNIKNQEEQAYYENLLNQLEAEQEQREREKQIADAQLAVTLEQLRTQLLQQQALYDEALKNLALAQNTLTDAQKAHLQPWITAVSNSKSAVEQATSAYETAFADYEEAVSVLDELQSDSLALRNLNRQIELADRQYQAADEAYQLALEAQEKDYSTIEAMDARRAEFEAQLEAIDKQLADLNVERTELEMETESEAANVNSLYQAYTAIAGEWDANGNLVTHGTRQYTMPAIEFENRNIPGLDDHIDYVNNMEVGAFPYRYSEYLQALANGTANNFGQKATLNRYINDVNSWTRTPNDDAWTNDAILQYQASLTALNTQITATKAVWQQAVDAYVGNLDIDPTEVPGYGGVETAVEAYNTAAAAYNAAVTAYNTYGEENLESWEVYNAAYDAAWEVFDQANEANLAEYNNTIQEAYQELQQAEAAYYTAVAELRQAWAEYNLLENPTAEDYNRVTEAQTAVTTQLNLYKEAADYYFDEVQPEAQELLDKKTELAEANREVAIQEARETYIENAPNDAAIIARENELYDAMIEANNDLNEAYDDAQDAYAPYASNYGLYTWSSVLSEAYFHYDDEGNWVPQQADTVDVAELNRNDLLNYIQYLSVSLFGVSDRLVDFTAEEMQNEIETAYMDANPSADFVPYRYVNSILASSYGMVGRSAYYQAQIDIANAVLDNEDAVAALKQELTDALADVNAQIAAVGAQADAAEQAYNTADAALKAKFADIDARIEDATASRYATKPILDAIISAIDTYVGYENVSASTLEELNKLLADAVEQAEQKRYDMETALLQAQKNLDDYTAGTKDWIEIAKENVDEAAENLSEKQDELAAANDALLAEIDRISQQQSDEVTE